MVSPKEIFSAIQQFLHKSQSLGFIREFTLSQVDNLVSTPEFQKTLDELRKKINNDELSIELSKKEFLHASPEKLSELEHKNISEDQTDQNKAIVQIQVDKSEMQRRISAFKSWKRKEVEECNVQEFCSRPYLEEINPLYEQVDTCSRVDTVFMPRFGSKGHYKVSKVENRYGPVVHTNASASKKIKKEVDAEAASNPNAVSIETIEERLQAMESHLKIKTESSLRCNIIQRLKKLEDRILFLEGMSPDYLHLVRPSFTSPQKKAEAEKEKLYSNLNFNDLQKRMQTIREALKSKSSQLQKNIS